jgi:hypothetical protein
MPLNGMTVTRGPRLKDRIVPTELGMTVFKDLDTTGDSRAKIGTSNIRISTGKIAIPMGVINKGRNITGTSFKKIVRGSKKTSLPKRNMTKSSLYPMNPGTGESPLGLSSAWEESSWGGTIPQMTGKGIERKADSTEDTRVSIVTGPKGSARTALSIGKGRIGLSQETATILPSVVLTVIGGRSTAPTTDRTILRTGTFIPKAALEIGAVLQIAIIKLLGIY